MATTARWLEDAVAGALRPGQRITWTRNDGTVEDLTGATLTGFLSPLATGVVRAIAGTLVLFDADSGVFDWNYAAGDVVAGYYQVQFVATYASGPTPGKTFTAYWRVHESLA